jgi:hypothetical protein
MSARRPHFLLAQSLEELWGLWATRLNPSSGKVPNFLSVFVLRGLSEACYLAAHSAGVYIPFVSPPEVGGRQLLSGREAKAGAVFAQATPA